MAVKDDDGLVLLAATFVRKGTASSEAGSAVQAAKLNHGRVALGNAGLATNGSG